MGEIASKQKAFDVIDLTEGKWKKEMEKLIPSKDKTNSKINIQLVGHEAVQHPWLMICDAKFHGEDIAVSETIPKERLPYERVKKPGMVIMIMGGENCKFNPYYPDPRIKYITGVESNFNTTWKARQSIEGFIIEDFCRLDRNEYGMTGDEEPTFLCRKGFHAINVQAIVDANLRFTSIGMIWPGSMHDYFMLTNLSLPNVLEGIDGWLLGNSG